MVPKPFKQLDVDKLLSELTIPEKVALLAGRDMWHTVPVERLGIPSIRLTDGPNGARGTRFFNGVPSGCFPCATGLASSFDLELAKKVGHALGAESKAKGAHVLLGPTVNIQRSPLGGRSFESYSEDPFLSGKFAAAVVNGLQAEGVAGTIKHYVTNDAETERMSVSSELSERALREIYLEPFRIVVRESKTAYNRVNGLHASHNKRLLEDVLRREWGWEGLVMSDWYGTYSGALAVKAGLDLEMPGPTTYRGPVLHRDLTSQELFPEHIDARVREVLKLINRVQPNGVPEDADELGNDTAETRALLREAAADSNVLLKNDRGLLPLAPSTKKIAVIGPNAEIAIISGGGSASMRPYRAVSPLEGIRAAVGKDSEVTFAQGLYASQLTDLLDGHIVDANGEEGVDMVWYADARRTKELHRQKSVSTNATFYDGVPSFVPKAAWATLTGKWTPASSGKWNLGVAVSGTAQLYINDKLIADTDGVPKGDLFFGNGSEEVLSSVDVEGGKQYKLKVHFTTIAASGMAVAFMSHGAVRLGARKVLDEKEGIAEAVKTAKEADVAVVVIGLNHELESEGFDRRDIDLPGGTDQLIEAVLAANPKTVVVVQTGSSVAMPWADKAPAIVQSFYGGNEVGHGLADTLFNIRGPSAKLSLTFPERLEDVPSHLNFPGENGKVFYAEGVHVGYRHYTTTNKKPLFPFGYGLTYSTSEYSDLQAYAKSFKASDGVRVSVKVTNTGKVAAREVVQLYVNHRSPSIARPVRELKAFGKTALLEPGKSETLELCLQRDAFAFYHERKDGWVAEKGVYELQAAASSEDVKLSVDVEVKETELWKGL